MDDFTSPLITLTTKIEITIQHAHSSTVKTLTMADGQNVGGLPIREFLAVHDLHKEE